MRKTFSIFLILALCLSLTACGSQSASVIETGTETAPRQTTAATTEPTTVSTTAEPTVLPTTQETIAPTEPSTEAPAEPSTEPSTEPPTEPPTEPSTEPREGNGRDYVLNTNTRKFHYPDCSSVDKIKPQNRQDFHGTREQILEMGYIPCKICNP